MAIYAKIIGKKQGAITGATSAKGFETQITVETCEFGLGVPVDVSTGQVAGKRVPRPVRLTKPVDKSSPLLYMACTQNESLSVQISYIVEGASRGSFLTLNFTDAMLRDFQHVATASASAVDKVAVETLSFTYTTMEFTWVEGGITAADDWTT